MKNASNNLLFKKNKLTAIILLVFWKTALMFENYMGPLFFSCFYTPENGNSRDRGKGGSPAALRSSSLV